MTKKTLTLKWPKWEPEVSQITKNTCMYMYIEMIVTLSKKTTQFKIMC